MPASKAQQRAVTKYVKNRYDRFGLTMPKGRLDEIKASAAAQGESVNGFINRAIDSQMGRDASSGPTEAPTAITGAGVVSLPFDTLKAAREAAEATGEALPVFVTRAVETQAQRDALSRKMKGGAHDEHV
ncbi:hypothetical protein [uncultured Oscillibacter sp.]|uniref:hypothetical protein n=1 Tax=uncultured Oscillibacter sp. TaxID=876091 RepID=UPI00262E14AA|nr:hypothetical protein [uncultured Oscillibacter sp.]